MELEEGSSRAGMRPKETVVTSPADKEDAPSESVPLTRRISGTAGDKSMPVHRFPTDRFGDPNPSSEITIAGPPRPGRPGEPIETSELTDADRDVSPPNKYTVLFVSVPLLFLSFLFFFCFGSPPDSFLSHLEIPLPFLFLHRIFKGWKSLVFCYVYRQHQVKLGKSRSISVKSRNSEGTPSRTSPLMDCSFQLFDKMSASSKTGRNTQLKQWKNPVKPGNRFFSSPSSDPFCSSSGCHRWYWR